MKYLITGWHAGMVACLTLSLHPVGVQGGNTRPTSDAHELESAVDGLGIDELDQKATASEIVPWAESRLEFVVNSIGDDAANGLLPHDEPFLPWSYGTRVTAQGLRHTECACY